MGERGCGEIKVEYIWRRAVGGQGILYLHRATPGPEMRSNAEKEVNQQTTRMSFSSVSECLWFLAFIGCFLPRRKKAGESDDEEE